jgi:hypothetical protein
MIHKSQNVEEEQGTSGISGDTPTTVNGTIFEIDRLLNNLFHSQQLVDERDQEEGVVYDSTDEITPNVRKPMLISESTPMVMRTKSSRH